jgi:hypothetical protein
MSAIQRAKVVLILGLSGLLSVLAFDHFYWRLDIFREVWPNFSRGHLLRSSAIILSISALCFSAYRYRSRLNGSATKGPDQLKWSAFERWSVSASLLTSLGFLILFLLKPFVFSALSLEDQPVEWASAAFLFAGSALFAAAFLKSRGNRQLTLLIRVTLLLFMVLLLLIGLEETSWFQRVFNVSPPDKFLIGNVQSEINLHNFATNLTENAYYFGGFVFLVMLPFMRVLGIFPAGNRFFDIFIPRSYLIGIGALACAYNFDMWNIAFTQVEFFGSVAILLTCSAIGSKGFERPIFAGIALLVVVTQAVFLARGKWFDRFYEVTEFKEMFIPLGFALFALDVYRRVNRRPHQGKGLKRR